MDIAAGRVHANIKTVLRKYGEIVNSLRQLREKLPILDTRKIILDDLMNDIDQASAYIKKVNVGLKDAEYAIKTFLNAKQKSTALEDGCFLLDDCLQDTREATNFTTGDFLCDDNSDNEIEPCVRDFIKDDLNRGEPGIAIHSSGDDDLQLHMHKFGARAQIPDEFLFGHDLEIAKTIRKRRYSTKFKVKVARSGKSLGLYAASKKYSLPLRLVKKWVNLWKKKMERRNNKQLN